MPEKKKKPKVNISIDSAGVISKSSGETVLEALENLEVDWKRVRYKNIMTVKSGKSETERLYNIVKMKRLLNNKQFKTTEAKYIELLLK